MKYSIIALIVIPLISSGQGSHSAHITCRVNSTKLSHFNLYKFGMNDQLKSFTLDTSISITPYKWCTFDVNIPVKGMYAIEDGFTSHSVFIRPGDTLSLTFTPVPDFMKQIHSKHPIFTRHIMQVNARYPGNILYFDSMSRILPKKYGLIKNQKPLEYKNQCDSIYHIIIVKLNNMLQLKWMHITLFPKKQSSIRVLGKMLKIALYCLQITGKQLSLKMYLKLINRLSTVRNADKITVLKKGQIVEEGTHEYLASLKGKYYELGKNQLELGN